MKKEKTGEQSASFFHELGGFMKPYSRKYAASVIISTAGVAAGVGSYAFIGAVAEMLFSGNIQKSAVLYCVLGAVLCKLIYAVFLNVSTWISHKAAYFTLRDIRNAVSGKLLRLPMGYFEEHGSGRLKTMLVDRIEGMEKTLAHLLPEMTANLLAPLACSVWMFFIDWRLALCAVIWIFAGFSVTSGMMKGYEEKYDGQIKAFKGMNQAVVEYVNGIEVIKNFGRADECYRKYTDAVYGHAAYNVGWQKETQKYSALGMSVAPFSLFPVLIAGLIFFEKGSLDGGTLFMMIILTFGIFAPLMNAMTYFDQLAAMGTNAKEIKQVLEYPELKRGSELKSEKADIQFKNVKFTYSGAKEPAVNDMSFNVPEGTMFALAGPSGSGKSTVGKLIAGFWDADSGDIMIGGKSVNSYSGEELNKMIAYVDQDTFLFDDTIMNNIRTGCRDADDSKVIEVAKKAGCDEFIRALPDGYNTMAGTAGDRLSGGEKQRIAIARAMMKNAPVMVLDEATASTDPENEASIQASLSAAAKGKTLIVIAHRLNTIMNAQQIAYIDKGRIKALGTHEELLRESPEYAELWKLGEGKRND